MRGLVAWAACLVVVVEACGAVTPRQPARPAAFPITSLDAAGTAGPVGWVLGGGDLYVTPDLGAASWSRVPLPAGAPAGPAVAMLDGRTVQLAWLPRQGSSTVVTARSTTLGASWQSVDLPLRRPGTAWSASLLVAGSLVWLVVNEQLSANRWLGELFESRDGSTWTVLPDPPGPPGRLLANGLGYSVNQWGGYALTPGSTWKPLPGVPGLRPPVPSPDGGVYYLARDGMWSSPDGLTFARSTSPTDPGGPGSQTVLAARGGGRWTAFASSPAAIWTSVDDGRTWNQSPPSSRPTPWEMWFWHDEGWGFAPNQGHCASFKSDCTMRSYLWRTADGGITWIPLIT